jgi:hypothetical protein
MGVPLPEGPSPIFSLPPAIFCGAITVGRFSKELLTAAWNMGQFLGILRKTSKEKMPKNRAEKTS